MKRILRSSGLAGGIAAVVALAAIPMLATMGAQPAADVMTPGELVSPGEETGDNEEGGSKIESPTDMKELEPVLIHYNEVIANENSGIYGANYTYTDENGVIYGYYVTTQTYTEGEYVTDEDGNQQYVEKKKFRITDAVIKGTKSIYKETYIPSYIMIAIPEDCDGAVDEEGVQQYATYCASKAEFHHDLVNEGVETSFPRFTQEEASALRGKYNGSSDDLGDPNDIVISPYVKEVRWTGKFDTTTTNFHFRSLEVPQISGDEFAHAKLTFWVPEDLYFTYRDYIREHYSSLTVVIRSESPLAPIHVNVAEPGTLAQEIVKLVSDLATVRYVIVSGVPDQEDLRMFRRMPNLEILDLSETTGLTEVSGLNGMENLREVVLPDGVVKIGDFAFENCTSLNAINIPEGVKEIASAAFQGTSLLKELNLPSTLKIIGNFAFRGSGISNINLENVEILGEGSFMYCYYISEANLISAKEIHDSAFSSSAINNVNFSDKLVSLGYRAFYSTQLMEVTLPTSLHNLGYGAFDSQSLRKIVVENSPYTNSWSSGFEGTRAEEIIWKPLFPSKNVFGGTDALQNAVAYVPALTYSDYLLSDAWAGCKDIRPLEEDLDYVYLDRDYTLRSEKGLTSTAKFVIGQDLTSNEDNNRNYGHLTVNRKLDLPLGQFEMNGRTMRGEYWTGDYYKRLNGYDGSTFIPKSTVTANEAVLNISMRKDGWHFLSFPFDVKVSEIEVEDEALWVVRRYSGEDRANLTGNTWQNMQADDVLEAGKGYIFHCTKDDNGSGDESVRDYVQFTFRPAADNSGLLNTGNTVTALQAYPSEFAHNAHWNLVGNSYPAYLSLRGVNFDAPVTVWDGYTYVAYSPVDDDYAFSPFQAFFVQMQETEGGDALTLDARARAHSSEEALAIEIEEDPVVDPADPETPAERPAFRAARAAAADRALFNITLSDGTASDRARLVINDAAQLAYEPSRDASKFMSSANGVPQIFVMNGNERMAIDERPYGEGVYTLGVRFGKSGEYSVSLDGKNIEGYVAILTDNLTGVSTEISSVPYAFTADAGTDEGRFTLELRRGISTGIDDAAADGISISAENGLLTVKAPAEVEITVAAADGRLVAADKGALLTVELPEGVYVVKAGETVRKINIR